MNILNVYDKNLKRFRTKKDISLEELALLCDLNRNYIGLIKYNIFYFQDILKFH